MRRWRFRSLPLRSRLALLTGVAVAVAVAIVAITSWLVTREEVLAQFDSQLKEGQHVSGTLVEALCNPQSGIPLRPSEYAVQIVRSDGTVCKDPDPDAVTFRVTSSDIAVATGQRQETERDTTLSNGANARVVTQPLRLPSGLVPGAALSIAAPLNAVERPLDALAVVLFIVAGIGVVGATTAGLGIARAGLKPVDRLTDAVEHIARTEDLEVRIPVEGEDEIARLSASFNSMTAALASSRERQQQLIADAGHELRTPLTSLRTNIELLSRSEETGRPLPPEDRRALMASVKAQMSELALLIGDLQELSRPDALPGSGPVQTVGLHDVIEHALKRARLRGPDLKIAAELSPWYVEAEPASLERAVVNLLDNAVKFSPPGGSIEVHLAGGELTVRDHGPGIPAEDLPHVFERFWRSPSARSLPGSGLGLSIVARTIQQAGGAVALHPAPGGGTTAVVNLPGTPTAPPESDE
ncbi:HAMP domain-containing histidine kinase [Streptomyces sp. RB6PN25]|uniref:histidine kinase n=1 Tax=Streptomyces humicola TaxID=2953240 RepID=A0ABT1Q3U4_9ACTN|nr:HAMP domain-containing sensor histidine kinase [Streptomyces humicola]MCQ4084601.1 HAMP domain-containing histidine kinase [Streptomyces humicola]